MRTAEGNEKDIGAKDLKLRRGWGRMGISDERKERKPESISEGRNLKSNKKHFFI